MRILLYLVVALSTTVLFTSCEHTVRMETTVHPDGGLDKVFIFENKDSTRNVFGLKGGKGWTKSVVLKSEYSKEDYIHITTFSKHFDSAEDANKELAAPGDTVLRVSSTFEKQFRWFYTYIHYSETIHAANNLRLSTDDFLVREDYEFIDRLPAEGKPISKGDAYYLEALNKRMYDGYGARAMFNEYLAIGEQAMADEGLEKRWMDTLRFHQENIFRKFQGEGDLDEYFLLKALDSIGIPLDTTKAKASYHNRYKTLERKLDFISKASEGKYHIRINMPWPVVASNADSLAGSSLFWSPPSIKFLVKDYTMSGECRKPNYSMWVLSAGVVGFTLFLLVRKRSRLAINN